MATSLSYSRAASRSLNSGCHPIRASSASKCREPRHKNGSTTLGLIGIVVRSAHAKTERAACSFASFVTVSPRSSRIASKTISHSSERRFSYLCRSRPTTRSSRSHRDRCSKSPVVIANGCSNPAFPGPNYLELPDKC